jgi:hypothetical protein
MTEEREYVKYTRGSFLLWQIFKIGFMNLETELEVSN